MKPYEERRLCFYREGCSFLVGNVYVIFSPCKDYCCAALFEVFLEHQGSIERKLIFFLFCRDTDRTAGAAGLAVCRAFFERFLLIVGLFLMAGINYNFDAFEIRGVRLKRYG